MGISKKSSTFVHKSERCITGDGFMNHQPPKGITETMRKSIEVVAAVILDAQGRIFATQRGYGEWKDWWEFPGGKIEPGETPQQALHREIREELDADIVVGELIRTINYDYPAFHLTMHCFRCALTNDRLTLLEHEAAKWLKPKELQSVRWLPADEEIIELLMNKRL